MSYGGGYVVTLMRMIEDDRSNEGNGTDTAMGSKTESYYQQQSLHGADPRVEQGQDAMHRPGFTETSKRAKQQARQMVASSAIGQLIGVSSLAKNRH